MGDQFISRYPTCLRPLKAAALVFFSSTCALWLTQCSLLGSGRESDCLACPTGSNGNIPWEKISSGVSWSAVKNTLYSKHSNRELLAQWAHKSQRRRLKWSLFSLGFRRSVEPGSGLAHSQARNSLKKPLNENPHLSALVSPVQGYVGAAARPDLAKAHHQHLRQ